MTSRFLKLLFSIGFCSLFAGCLPDSGKITPHSLFEELGRSEISTRAVDPNKFPELYQAVPGYVPLGIYTTDNFSWALFDMPDDYAFTIKLNVVSNQNLHIVSDQPIPQLLKQSFKTLIPELGYEQLGIFAYPLALCLLISIFITLERLYSLRRGLTFPRKVEKALLKGEFPDKKWKQGSAAERIVHVAIKEKASEETLRAYAKLEVSSMERGMFLLEVIVAGAPLIGLLGTVTGLVEVFSQMPTGGTVDKSLFSQGISLALLTTMVGLAIALPTLLFNSYLQRILDKRASALEWLTARLIEATDRKGIPPEIIR
jgi:biopolymer transport protein ExbB